MFCVSQPSKLHPGNPGPCKWERGLAHSPALLWGLNRPASLSVCNTEGERAEAPAWGPQPVHPLCLSKATAAAVQP